jgi:hypothetical protein
VAYERSDHTPKLLTHSELQISYGHMINFLVKKVLGMMNISSLEKKV